MKSIFFSISLLYSFLTAAQESINFQHIKTHIFDREKVSAKFPGAAFGGISAIEGVDSNSLTLMCADCNTTASNMFLLFSDKLIGDRDNVFQMNDIDTFIIQNSLSMYNMQDVESVRYNAGLGLLCYSYEGGEETGVRIIDIATNKEKTLLTMPNPTNNRGIEGLAFTTDNSLWIALETGSPDCAEEVVDILKIKYDATNRNYDAKGSIAYKYPLDKCACLGNSKTNIDGTNGNGVTEIIGIKGYPNQLLVLERCFNRGTLKGSTYLYLATIDEANKTISKDRMLFDFTTESFPNAGRNIEGMCWADDETLLLVADDNFSERQVGQVIVLKIEH